nr:helix-turn-helix domain-containing protein [Pontibacter sp. SGAir0037]
METNHEIETHECKKTIMAVHDAMDVLNGKWKISIVASLCFNKKRYSDILREVTGISGKMLSRELKDMEMNELIKRTVLDTQPVTVEYELTEYGQKLKSVIEHLATWGTEHRKKIIGK